MKTVQSFIFSETKSNVSIRSSKSRIIKYGPLPQHILRQIFSYLSEDDLKKSVLDVCQQWRETAEDPVLWENLKFYGNKIPNSYICQKIWQFNQIEKISIRYRTETHVILRQICRCSRNLTHLVLRHCSNITEESLRYLLTACKNLQSLDLKGSPFKSLIFFEEITHAKALKVINFSENPYFTLKHIMMVIMNVENMKGFHLSNLKPSNNILLNDVDCYFMLTHTVLSLKYLTLDCSSLSNYTFCSILKCKNLEYLCLNYAYNLEGKEFENLWKNLTQLKTLKIRFAHNVKDSNLVGLLENGGELVRNFEVVDFTGCTQIGDSGIEALANYCANLKSLVIRNCPKFSSVLPVLSLCEKLEILNVAFCKNLCLKTHPIPTNLKKLYISETTDQLNFAKTVKQINANTIIRICDNEFNKCTVKWYISFINDLDREFQKDGFLTIQVVHYMK